MVFRNILSLLIVTLIAQFSYTQSYSNSSQIDSILILRKLSNNDEIELAQRFGYGESASLLSERLDIDSTKLKSYRNLSRLYLNSDSIKSFGDLNKKILNLSIELQDTLHIAYTYENLGYYYYREFKNDSAYYNYFNASKLYDQLNDVSNGGLTLFMLANIQEVERDYVGSEANAIKALRLIESLEKSEYNLETISLIYNVLANNSIKQGDYDEAIRYYNRIIETYKDSDFYLYLYLNTKNSIGFTLIEKGAYNEALEVYNEIITYDGLEALDPALYSIILGNIALVKNKMDVLPDKEVESLFLEAYRYSDSINDLESKSAVSIDIADYYFNHTNLDAAKRFGEIGLTSSKQLNDNKKTLRSLLLLSKVVHSDSSKYYLYDYIKLSDSLLNKERLARNKFAKIEFETEQIQAEKEQLSKERFIFLVSSISLFVLLVLLYVIITQRAKNKELEFNKKQQEANEEIYNLMLGQQDKVDEGRTKEKKRISEELHDGILGRLFGTRLSLDSLNLVKTDEAMKSRSMYINELKNIEQEIRKVSHDLNADFISGSGFMDIVKTLVENQTKAYELEFSLGADDAINWEKVSNKTKIHIYRMLQETMQNIYKHAKASRVSIGFTLKNDVILMRVEDDGEGFNVEKARKGIGIKNINSRVKEIEGKVDIDSTINKGTIISINVPI